MDRQTFSSGITPAILGALVTVAVAAGSAAIGSAKGQGERISSLESNSRTYSERLDRIERKVDLLLERPSR